MKIGDRVRFIGPSLSDKPAPIGTVVRMPLAAPGKPARADDSRVMVAGMSSSRRRRPRPVRPEDLEVVSG
jgi:hypothetical protein